MKKHFNKHDVADLRALRRHTLAISAASQSPDAPKEKLSMQPGDLIEGEGGYLGQYSPADRDGNSLRKTFNVFAAPEDLPGDIRNYADTVQAVAEIGNWYGYDGTNYADDEEIYNAIRKGSYNGDWIIPTRDILTGRDAEDNNRTTPDNLLVHKDSGAFKGTFRTAAETIFNLDWYWSSTAHHSFAGQIWNARMSDGSSGYSRKDDDSDNDTNDDVGLSYCRPVRLVAVP